MTKINKIDVKKPIVLTNTKPTTSNEITVPVGQPTSKVKTTPPFREMGDRESYEDYKKARAIYYFKNDIESGKLEYVEPTKILGKEFGGHYFVYHSDEGEKLGDIKNRYNIPDGVLGNQSPDVHGGNIDKHRADKRVRIEETDMEEVLKQKILHKTVTNSQEKTDNSTTNTTKVTVAD